MTLPKAWRRTLLLAALAALYWAPATAFAEPTEAQKQEAKQRYENARKLYDIGRYTEAIDEYQKIYLLTDDPNMLFNIAQCYRFMDRPEEAVRFYRNYL